MHGELHEQVTMDTKYICATYQYTHFFQDSTLYLGNIHEDIWKCGKNSYIYLYQRIHFFFSDHENQNNKAPPPIRITSFFKHRTLAIRTCISSGKPINLFEDISLFVFETVQHKDMVVVRERKYVWESW